MPRSTYTTTVALAYEDALEILGQDAVRVVQDATDRAAVTAEDGAVVRPLRCEIVGFELSRDVAIEVGPLVPAEMLRATVPLRWQAAEGSDWFPSVEATLDLSPTHGDVERTTLTLRAEQRPPFGVAGAVLHRTLARGLVDETLERFLGELADGLRAAAEDIDLSSEMRTSPSIGQPLDLAREVRFDAQAAVWTPLQAGGPDGEVHLVGVEPWQGATVDATEVTVTLTVLSGRARLTRGASNLDLEGGQLVVIPAGGEATLIARGQRLIAVAHRLAVRAPTSASDPATIPTDVTPTLTA